MVSVKLTDIVETSLTGERMLVAVGGGQGLRLDIDQARRFRTELAAAAGEVGT